MAEAVTQIIQSSQAIELVVEQPFYIPMTGPATRPRRSLKHDDTFIVLDSHGDIGASAGGPDGLFNADTRYLAKLQLGEIAGVGIEQTILPAGRRTDIAVAVEHDERVVMLE